MNNIGFLHNMLPLSYCVTRPQWVSMHPSRLYILLCIGQHRTKSEPIIIMLLQFNELTDGVSQYDSPLPTGKCHSSQNNESHVTDHETPRIMVLQVNILTDHLQEESAFPIWRMASGRIRASRNFPNVITSAPGMFFYIVGLYQCF